MSARPDPKNPSDDDPVDWFTISYKTLYSIGGLVLLLILGGLGFRYRDRFFPKPAPSPSAAASTNTSARFTSLEGSVKVRPVGQFEWLAADRSMVLRKGDLVRTGSGTTAEITFFDGTVVHVRPDSLIAIEEAFEDPTTKKRKVAWHINSGEVNFKTAERSASGAGQAEISTPTVRVTQGEAATGGIRVDESGEADLRQFSGKGEAETRTGEKFALSGNEGVRVDRTGKAGPKVALPEAPVVLAPPHQAEIAYVDPSRATTVLVWKPVPNASSYHVMLDYSPFFNRPLVDQKGVKDSSVELRGLEVGKYYWRVAAVDQGSVEGPFSSFARFSVTRPEGSQASAGPPPPLAIDGFEVRETILQIKGRTEPGASVTVNGQRVDVQNDGSFNEFVTLGEQPGQQTVLVRAVGVSGGVREIKRTVEVR